MKIEACEQLISSWLKNIKKCQIVQTNWTPSYNFTISDEDFELFSMFVDEIKELVDDIDIFKKSNISQFIKQAEVDVVGIKLSKSKVDELYLIDSAFHQAGLGYKDNSARISKKLIRAIGVAELYFKEIPTNVVFVSPFARESVINAILTPLEKIKKTTNLYPNMNISVIFNQDFVDQIYEPLISEIDNINEDTDLFMRCAKIINLCENKRTNKNAQQNYTEKQNCADKYQNKSKNDNETTIFFILTALKENGKLTDELLNNLQSNKFTNRMFKMPTYPFLIRAEDFEKSNYESKRFYKNLFYYNDASYYVCSQWIPERVEKLKEWFRLIEQS